VYSQVATIIISKKHLVSCICSYYTEYKNAHNRTILY